MHAAQMPEPMDYATLFRRSWTFSKDFGRFAGRKGLRATVLVLLGAMFEGIGIALLIPILSVIVSNGEGNGATARAAHALFSLLHIHGSAQQLLVLLAIFVLAMTLRVIVIAARDIALNELQLRFLQSLRSSITGRLATTPWKVIAELRHARILHLMGSDIQNIGLATHLMIQCAISIVLLFTQVLLAILLSPALSILVLVFLATGLLAVAPIMKRASQLGHFVTDANLSLMNDTIQFLGALKLAISQNLQHNFVAEYDGMLTGITRRSIDNLRQSITIRIVLTSLSAFAAAITIFVGFGILHIAPTILIALTLILARMSGPVMLLQQNAQTFAQTLPAYKKVTKLERELGSTHSAAISAWEGYLPRGPIVIQNVSYHHGKNGGGFRDINLTLEPGTIIGLTGSTGAGKTTFADLIVGLLPPSSGEISVGGTVLRGASIPAWQHTLSYISQDPFLFHGTIRHNLLWAAPDATEDDLRIALEIAGATDIIARLEHGMETIVGERGIRMSGGERQRLAIARALARNPRLLVLDEATNAIDISNEHEILRRITKLKAQPTILMITHRAESLPFCDRTLILKDGVLTETTAPSRGSERVA
jgi:ATP-binding cassette subfamily C protein